MRGNWAGGSSAAGTAYESISFGFTFASAPTFHYVPGPVSVPAGCAGGTNVNPTAQPGNLCLYLERLRVEHARRRGHRRSNAWGALYTVSSDQRGAFADGGTWAATSPLDDRVTGAGFVEAVEKAQASAPAGSTKRSGVRDSAPPPTPSREPCRPLLGPAETVVSGCPAWATIHAITAAKSAPSARIAARSITSPPER